MCLQTQRLDSADTGLQWRLQIQKESIIDYFANYVLAFNIPRLLWLTICISKSYFEGKNHFTL